jgi:hypothetical protein
MANDWSRKPSAWQWCTECYWYIWFLPCLGCLGFILYLVFVGMCDASPAPSFCP